MSGHWSNKSPEQIQAEHDRAYGGPTNDELMADARAKIDAANTPAALLRLCLPSVSFDASTGVIGAKDLLYKIHKVLERHEEA